MATTSADLDKEAQPQVEAQLAKSTDRSLQNSDDAEKSASDGSLPFKHEYPTGFKLFCILIPVTLAYFLFFLDLAIVSTATPAITVQFNSLVDVGWYGGAYQLGSAAFQPLNGKIYSYFSIKWSFLVFFFIFELGSALCGAAQSSSMFIVGRAIAGLGSSGITNGAYTILAACLRPRQQALFMGVNIGLSQVGLACGPLLGGAFTEYASWRWCFYINLPCAAVVGGLLVFVSIPETKFKPPIRQVLGTAVKSLDLPGFLLICPAAVMFLLALQFGGNEYAWNSSTVIGLFVGAGVTFALFLVWEHRQGDGAMVPFAMLKKRIIYSAAGTMFFNMGLILVADFYLAIYFQGVHNDSALMSGVHMLPTIIAMVVFTMTSGVMIQALGYYLPWVTTGTAVASVGYGLLSLFSPSTPSSKWIGYQVLYGAGSGAASSSSYIAVQNLVPAPQIPIAMSIVIFCQNLGGAVFLLAANTLFSNTLRQQLQKHVAEIGVAPDVIINAGVRSIRKLVSGEQLAVVLQDYSTGVDHVMYLGIGCALGAFCFSWGLGWKDIRVEKKLQAITNQSSESEVGELAPTAV